MLSFFAPPGCHRCRVGQDDIGIFGYQLQVDSNNCYRIEPMPRDIIETDPLIPLPDPVHYVQLKSMTEALLQAQMMAGLDDKEICGRTTSDIISDPSTWSKIKRGVAHFPHDKLVAFNLRVNNLIVLAWIAEQHGYTLRPKESELRKQLRRKDEMLREMEQEIAVLRKLVLCKEAA